MGPHGVIELPQLHSEQIDGSYVEGLVKAALKKLGRSDLPNRLWDVDEDIAYAFHVTDDGRCWVYFETKER